MRWRWRVQCTKIYTEWKESDPDWLLPSLAGKERRRAWFALWCKLAVRARLVSYRPDTAVQCTSASRPMLPSSALCHPSSQSGTRAFWYWTGSCIHISCHFSTRLTRCSLTFRHSKIPRSDEFFANFCVNSRVVGISTVSGISDALGVVVACVNAPSTRLDPGK